MLTHVRPEDFDPDRYLPPGILREVETICRNLPTGSVIAVHGWSSSGKTPTAMWLGAALDLRVIHLDEIRGPDGTGFDEEAARLCAAEAAEAGSVIVEGVCAARVCTPAVLVHMQRWPKVRLKPSLREFIGNYDPSKYSGTIATREATDGGPRSA